MSREGLPPCQHPDCTDDAHFRSGYTHCLDHDGEDRVTPFHVEPETAGIAVDDFTYFFGASCGSSRKTLRQFEEPNVLLSYATKCNTPWDGIETFMVDSGGYSLIRKGEGEYTDTVDDYLDYVEAHDVAYFMTRDVPITDRVVSQFDSRADALALSTEETIRTIEYARERGLEADPLPVIQGATSQDYVDHYHKLVNNLHELPKRFAIGSLKEYTPTKTAHIIRTVSDAVDDGVELHGLGVDVEDLEHSGVVDALASADSSRYIATARWRGNRDEHPPRLRDDEPKAGWVETARAYLDMRESLRETLDDELAPAAETIDAQVQVS